MQIPAGSLVDKIGQKKVLLPGFLLFGVAALIVALAPSIQMIYLGSVLAVILIIFMTITFQFVIKRPQTSPVVPQEPSSGSKKSEETAEISPKALFQPKMLFSYLLYFTTCYAYYMIVTWLPNFLATERGFRETAIGFSSSLGWLLLLSQERFSSVN